MPKCFRFCPTVLDSQRSYRARSTAVTPRTPRNHSKSPQRSQSMLRQDTMLNTPFPLTDDVQQQVSVFVEDNFHIQSSSHKKSSKNRSARTDYSSWKSFQLSQASPFEEVDERKTLNNTRVAFT